MQVCLMTLSQSGGNVPHVSSYRLQEGFRLVKAIKLFVLHHQEMSSIDDYSFQTDE